MGSMMLLYEAVRRKLPDRYKNVFYQYMRDDQIGDVGIYLYQGENDLYTIDGATQYNTVKVHVQVNADKSTQGLQEALDYLTEFVDRIENEQCDISNISFISANHIGPKAIPIGRNEFDIQVVKSDINLKYVFD